MGVPALLVDFPPPSSADAYAARSALLGRQWPTFWKVGNNFFRPISTLGMLGYVFSSYSAYTNTYTSTTTGGLPSGGLPAGADWRLFALSALCHLVNIVHSAVNMQPLNDKLEGLSKGGGGGGGGAWESGEEKEQAQAQGAVEQGQKWITGNYLRIIFPPVAAVTAIVQICCVERG
jgi:hypothetical protein